MKDTKYLVFGVGFIIIMLAFASGPFLVTNTAEDLSPESKPYGNALSRPSYNAASSFYGVQYVPIDELETVKELGVEVVLMAFRHDGPPEDWLAYLDEAQMQGIQVVAWLWPEGWSWDGSEWQIDDQAELFVQTVAGHPALSAVYSLHEPYWRGCLGCGYTTAEQQALYSAIKAIADVPIYSGVDSMSFWTGQGEETAFADGVCDYCATWHHPFKVGGIYERDKVIAQLTADLAVARERAPNSKIIWIMQSFAQGPPYNYRMPDADEMRDLASIVCSTDIDGVLWYPWYWDNDSYSDFLSNHPELYPVVREISETCKLGSTNSVYLPVVCCGFSN
jgi:hypothetical protein